MKKKKSMLVTLIGSNVLILAIAVCVAIVNFFGYRNFSSKQADGYHRIIARQIKTTFDQRMYSMKSILMDLSTDNLVWSMMNIEKEKMKANMYSVVEIRTLLASYVFTYDFLDSVIIYYPKSDSIISSQSYFSNLELFQSASYHAYWEQEQWEELTKESLQMHYHFQDDIFTMVCPVSNGRDWAYVIVNSNVSFLNQLIDEENVLENCSISMWDRDSGDKIFELGKGALTLEQARKLEQLEAEGESFRDGKNLITKVDSDVTNCSYYFMIPENTFTDGAIDVFTLSMTGIIVMIGIIAVVILAYYNFKPIQEVYHKIQKSEFGELEPDQSRNELEMIGAVTERTMRNYRDLKDFLVKYEPALQGRLAERILHGMTWVDSEVLETYRKVGFTLDYPLCYVIVAAAESAEEDILENIAWSRMDQWIENTLRIEGESVSYVTNSGYNQWVILVNTNVYEKKEIEDRLKAMTKMMQQEHQWNVTSVYTDCTSSWEELPRLFIVATKALEYQLIRCPGVVVFGEKNQEYRELYYYPLETEARLINCVKTGNIKVVNEIINEIIIQNFVTQQISMEAARCLGFNLIGTAFKVMSIQQLESEVLSKEQEHIYRSFLHCRNIYEIEVELRNLFLKICRNIQEKNSRQPSDLISQVKVYMEKNSADSCLSLASVAGAFDINPNYLSGSFKEQTGENFLEYLNKLRLEKVKKLLKESNATLTEIAEMTGYSNSAVLIRNFKKREGMTPGQYRTGDHV